MNLGELCSLTKCTNCGNFIEIHPSETSTICPSCGSIIDLQINCNLQEIRCKKCGKMLGKITGEYEIKCPRCKAMNTNIKKESIKDEFNLRT
jgi:phage FluMu protein Com